MLRNTIALLALTLGAGVTASADFSYTNTMKTTGGTMAAMAGTAADRTNKYYFKGQKIMTSTGDVATIIDFGAQTVTTVNNAQKTYTVKKFSDVATGAGANMDMTVDVKDTGQTRVINGMNATEAVVTMDMDMDMGRGAPAMKMQMEMHLWISSEVPGSGEVRAFYEKNMANVPWTAMAGGGGNASVQKSHGPDAAGDGKTERRGSGTSDQNQVRWWSRGAANGYASDASDDPGPASADAGRDGQDESRPAGTDARHDGRDGQRRGAPAQAASGSIMEMTTDASDFSSQRAGIGVCDTGRVHTEVDALFK